MPLQRQLHGQVWTKPLTKSHKLMAVDTQHSPAPACSNHQDVLSLDPSPPPMPSWAAAASVLLIAQVYRPSCLLTTGGTRITSLQVCAKQDDPR